MGSRRVGDRLEMTGPYVGGVDGFPSRSGGIFRQSWNYHWKVYLGPDGVEITCERNYEIVMVASEMWTSLRGVSFSSGKNTVNPLAIAAFGVFGLGARIDWMLMDIGFSDAATFITPQVSATPQALFFMNSDRHEIALFQDKVQQIWPTAHGKFRIDDASWKVKEPGPEDAVLESLERAHRLHEAGSLSDEEFRQMKERILDS